MLLPEPLSSQRCMGRVRCLGIAALAATSVLVWTAAAEAKELSSFKACGASGCKAIKDPQLLKGLIHSVEAQGDTVGVSTPAPASFLRLEFRVRGDEATGPSFVEYYAPSRGRVAFNTDPGALAWVRPAPAVRALLDRVITGVTPFATPRITRVTLGGKPVRDPASYARLFTLKGKAESFPDDPDWKPIAIEMGGPTPWSTSAANLEYSPSKNVLWRGSEFVLLPSGLSAQLEARKSLASSPTRRFPWVLVFGGLAGAALIVPPTVLFRRRRRPG